VRKEEETWVRKESNVRVVNFADGDLAVEAQEHVLSQADLQKKRRRRACVRKESNQT
jgi:hypothetical protein